MFSNLLVPLDGSKLAESVVPVVTRLGQLFQCGVKLLHVIEKGAPSSIHGDTHLRDVQEAEVYLEAIAAGLRASGLEVSAHVHSVPEGDVPKSIAEHAEELEQDLIVICTHGSGGVRRFVFGSNAEQVLSHGDTPVMLVKAAPGGNPPPFGPKSIVSLLDKTPESRSTTAAGAELAVRSGARLHLLYVVPTLASVTPQEAASGRLAPQATRLLLRMEAEEAAVHLREEIETLRSNRIETGGRVERGDAAAAITAAAHRLDADIVVIAARGLAGLGAFLANALVPKVAASYDGILLLLPGKRG